MKRPGRPIVTGVVLGVVLGVLVWAAVAAVPWQDVPDKPEPKAKKTVPAAGDKPELDIVVKTAMRVAPKHTEAYAAALRTNAERCLQGLVDPAASVTADPPEGAAYFRLYIEHTGTVKVANATSKERLATESDLAGLFLGAQETGAYRFRLAKWTGARYVVVDQWLQNIVEEHFLPVGESVSNKEIGTYRTSALMQVMPYYVGEALLSRLVPIRFVKAAGAPGAAQTVTVAIQNRSPWPVASVRARIEWPDLKVKGKYRYEAEVSHDEPLAPGQQATVTAKGALTAARYRWQMQAPMRVEALPVFDPSSGPEWIARQVAGLKGKDAGARQQRLDALAGQVDTMTAEESAAVVGALLGLLAHDAPTGEDDLPADALATLVPFGVKAPAALAEGLKSDSPGVRLGACLALAQAEIKDKAVLTRLHALVNDKCEAVGKAAAKVLEANGQTVAAPQPKSS